MSSQVKLSNVTMHCVALQTANIIMGIEEESDETSLGGVETDKFKGE